MKRPIVLAAGIAVVAVVALLLVLRDDPTPLPPEPDLWRHPVYSSYDFGQDDLRSQAVIVNVGTQPLSVPTGMITAAMARDAVLKQQLGARGMEVRFFPFLKGQDVNFFLGEGFLHAGVGGNMPALTAAATLDVAVTSLTQTGFTSIVARRDMLVSELRGQRIACAAGSNAHAALLSVLASEGLSEEQVRLIPMDADGMPGALLDGAIDAFAAWEPFVSISLDDVPSHAVVQRSLSSVYLHFSQRFVDQHPGATREIVAAEFRAIAWMGSSVENMLAAGGWAMDESFRLATTASGTSPAALARMAARDLLGPGLDIRVPRSFLEEGGQLAAEFEFLQGRGRIPASASWEVARDACDSAIVAEPAAKPVHYRLWDFQYDVGQGLPR